jgi:hypothetical protein
MYTQLQLRDSARPPVNVASLGRMKEQGEKISCITCYDASFAALTDDQELQRRSGCCDAPQGCDRQYPLDSVESLKVHCRTICGLTKPGKGKSAKGLPEGWPIAERIFPRTGK